MTRSRPVRLRVLALEARDNPSSLPTVQLTNVNFVSGPDSLTPVGNTLYFAADDGVHGRQLWRTNGQVGDAVPVQGEFQGLNSPPLHGPSLGGTNWAVSGSWLYYLTDDNGTITLWRNDSSTPPTNGVSPSQSEVIAGATDDPDGNGPWDVTAVGHDLYFGAYEPADANWHLWKVPGADASGTAIPTAAPFDYPGLDSNGLFDVTGAGSTLYFTADASGTANKVIWASDGTLADTAPVRDSQGNYVAGELKSYDSVAVGNSLYAIPDGGTLWRINGPGQAADQIATVGGAPDGLNEFLPPDYHMTRAGNSIYFVANRAGGGGIDSYFVWKCSGTTAEQIWNSTPPSDFQQPPSAAFVSGPLQLVSADTGVYVSDETPSSLTGEYRLWKLDGTPGNATLVEAAGSSSPAPQDPAQFAGLTVAGSTLYYWDYDGHLAQSQGTAATTYPTDVQGVNFSGNELRAAYDPLSPIAAIGSTLYFAPNTGSGGLWRTDPFSQAGTQAALDGPLPTDPATGDPTVTLDGTTQAQADSFLNLFNPSAPGYTPLAPPAGATTPIDVVVNFDPSIQINEANLVIPQGIRVQINGGTWHGGSPALTLNSGDLTITGATFVNDTPAATILVNGGNLTLRDCVIEGTSFDALEFAIQVNGGTVDAGTSADPGGNSVNVNPYGMLIENTTTGTVYAFGDHWTSNELAVPPGPLVVGPVVWGATPTVTVTGGTFAYDEHPHPATGSVIGTSGATVGTPTFNYSYTDNSGNVVATTAPPVDPGNYTVTATFEGNDDYMPASATATITIYYDVRTLTDLSKAFKAGRTIPIKIELTDASGANVSSPDISVLAMGLYRINADGSRTQVTLQDAGGSNPDDLFRYDASLGGYIFNLSTKDLGAGTYAFDWTADGDPTTHELQLSLV